MTLTGTQFGALQKALLSAFPTSGALGQLVRVRLDKNLDEIVAGVANLTDAVFATIQWADAQGRTIELIGKAIEENPSTQT